MKHTIVITLLLSPMALLAQWTNTPEGDIKTPLGSEKVLLGTLDGSRPARLNIGSTSGLAHVWLFGGPTLTNTQLSTKFGFNNATGDASLGVISTSTYTGGLGLIRGTDVASPVVWMYNSSGKNAFTVAKADHMSNDLSSIGSALTPLFQVRVDGFVGIGTTNPTQKLSVVGQGVFLENSATPDPGDGTGSAIRLGYTSTSGGYGYINANNTGYATKSLALQQNGGNVGIGTYAPEHRLQVGNATSAVSLSLRGPDSNTQSGALVFEDNGGTGSKWFKLVNNTADNILQVSSPEQTNLLTFNRVSGSLGVGTYVTNAKLHIAQNGGGSGNSNGLAITAGNTNSYDGNNQILLSYAATSNYSHAIKTRHDGGNAPGNSIDFYVWKPGDAASAPGSNHVMSLNGGNVGIGTRNPDHKLDVKGTIHTEEVLVDLNVPAPDYVFEPDYDLATLAEIETYIKENKHLPEVPSAKEMEENGMNLKEMNLILLKKVEELTLHLIEQNKIIEQQKEMNEYVLMEIEDLKSGKN